MKQPVSRKTMKALFCVGGAACANPSAVFIDLCLATFSVLAITGKLSWPSNMLLLAGVCRSTAFRQPVSRKSHESFVLSGWVRMCQPYIESATTFSDDEQIIRKCRFNNLSSATFGKLCWT